MEAVIFIGIQAAGKTSFYRERFFETHIRLSMDMLRTRHREQLLVRACVEAKQPFVIDNTNVRAEERACYIALARPARFRIVGYVFQAAPAEALARNELRVGKARIPEKGVLSTYKRFERPQLAEGFDQLLLVTLVPERGFVVEEWREDFASTYVEGAAYAPRHDHHAERHVEFREDDAAENAAEDR